MFARVLRRQLAALADGAGQEAAAERAVGDEADAELPADSEDLALDVARPQRILGLQRRHLVRRMGAPDGLGRRLRDAEMAHLALSDELGHGADRVLDRHGGVDAMDVVEIDRLNGEAAQAGLAGLSDVCRPAVDGGRPVRLPEIAEFCRHHVFVAPSSDRAADQLLVPPLPIGVGSVDEIDAELGRAVERRDRLGRIRLAIDRRHAHAAEPDGGHFERSEFPAFHVSSSLLPAIERGVKPPRWRNPPA
jgi:hypothetical protein